MMEACAVIASVRFSPDEVSSLSKTVFWTCSLFPALIWHELSLLRADAQAGLLPAGQAHLN